MPAGLEKRPPCLARQARLGKLITKPRQCGMAGSIAVTVGTPGATWFCGGGAFSGRDTLGRALLGQGVLPRYARKASRYRRPLYAGTPRRRPPLQQRSQRRLEFVHRHPPPGSSHRPMGDREPRRPLGHCAPATPAPSAASAAAPVPGPCTGPEVWKTA